MPYIKQTDRDKVAESGSASSPGELNYMICKLVDSYVENNGHNYQHYNDIMGALVGALLETYIRVIRPYEDRKIVENGEVFTCLR